MAVFYETYLIVQFKIQDELFEIEICVKCFIFQVILAVDAIFVFFLYKVLQEVFIWLLSPSSFQVFKIWMRLENITEENLCKQKKHQKDFQQRQRVVNNSITYRLNPSMKTFWNNKWINWILSKYFCIRKQINKYKKLTYGE